MLDSAVFWGMGCAILWGCSNFCARFAGRAVGAVAATLAMMVVGGVLIAAIIGATGEPLVLRLDGVHWLLGIGAGVAFGSLLFYQAVTHGPLSLATPVVASYPAIAVPVSVILGAQAGPITWAAMAITMVGVWLVVRVVSNSGAGATRTEYAPAVVRQTIFYALAAATIYAVSLSAAARALEIYGPLQTVFAVRIIGVAIVGMFILLRRVKMRFPPRAWPILVSFGLLDTSGHVMIFVGMRLEHGEYTIVTSVGYTVVTVLLARIFLREPVSARQWGSIALVVAGVAILATFG